MADSQGFKCKLCNKIFKHNGHRNRHEQQVHDFGEEARCNDCGAVFSRMESLKRHRKSNHPHGNTQNNLRCNICQKTFGRKDSLDQHQRQVHSGVRYNCEHCKATFAQKYKLKKHLEKHSGGNTTQGSQTRSKNAHFNPDPGRSTSKKFEFDQKTGYQTEPKKGKLKRKANLPSTLNSTDSSDDGHTSKGMSKCMVCLWEGKSLKHHLNHSTNSCHIMYDNQALEKAAKKKHKEQKTQWESEHREERNKTKRIKRGTQRDRSKQQFPNSAEEWELTCSICWKKFGTSYAKECHMNEVHIKWWEPIQCPKCTMSFNRREHLRDHLEHVHNDITKVECLYCKKEFSSSQNFLRHIREVHEKNLRLQNLLCNICEKKFSRKEYLDRHISEVHLKQKRFSCPHCKKNYVRKDVLERHLFVAHQKQDRMIWPCPECPEYFFREDILDKHEKRGKHSFYEYCEYCDEVLQFKSFSARDSHFVTVKRLSFVDRERGFSKKTCVNRLQRDKEQMEQFEQGFTTCIHCKEVVSNKDRDHWITMDLKTPQNGTCITNMMKRKHIICWMCKERLVVTKDYFKQEESKWKLNVNVVNKRGFHYDNIDNPCSCTKSKGTERERKWSLLYKMRENKRMEILNKIPKEKKIGSNEFHIMYCNSLT